MAKHLTAVELTHLLRAVAESHGVPPPRYHAVAGKIRDGEIRSVRVGNRPAIPEDAVSAAAAVFGLPVPGGPGGPEEKQRREAA